MKCSSLPNTGKSRITGFIPAFTLILLFTALASISAAADPVVQITQCGTTITQPGHYILANDLNCNAPQPTSNTTSPTVPWQQMQNPYANSNAQAPTSDAPTSTFGILILADHVDLELNGHTISGNFNNINEFGISVGNPFSSSTGQSHVHIGGPGTVTGWFVGVVLTASSFSSVNEVTADANAIGLLDLVGSKNVFDGNTATNSLGFIFFAGGITLFQTNGDAVRNNTVNNNFFGIAVLGGTDTDIRFNSVNGNFGVGIGVQGTDNSIFHNTAQNTTGGFDLDDAGDNCTNNTWKHNTFGTASEPCIN